MAGGAFLADGIHFPVPPQAYMLLGVAGGYGVAPAFASVSVGSALGGLVAFAIARRLSRVRFLQSAVRGPRALVDTLFARHRYWGLAVAALLPISYWMLCSIGGLSRLAYRSYAVLALMRLPRLLLSYVVVVALWGTPHP
jgi:uncharacterized membrane protein YdjX (TVP38/TMEM64 family)